MNLPLKVAVGIGLLAATLVAQDNSKNKNQATTDTAGNREGAQNPTAVKKEAAPDAGKPGTRALTEKEKRGHALGVELGSDVAS